VSQRWNTNHRRNSPEPPAPVPSVLWRTVDGAKEGASRRRLRAALQRSLGDGTIIRMMDLRTSLKEQYHAGLTMLAECVEKCPEEMWTAGTHPRTFWRIAFHAAFFTQLYLGPDENMFERWPGCHETDEPLFAEPPELDPYGLPEGAEPYGRDEILVYIGFVDARIDALVDALDLDREDPGISWYKGISKLSHVLMNLRHIQGHVGQLSELLMARGIDTNWIAKSAGLGR